MPVGLFSTQLWKISLWKEDSCFVGLAARLKASAFFLDLPSPLPVTSNHTGIDGCVAVGSDSPNSIARQPRVVC